MSELRPPTPEDLEAFPDPNEMDEYGELAKLDDAWEWLYGPDDTLPTLADYDAAKEEALILESLDHPLINEHIVGFVYSWHHTPDSWTTSYKMFRMFAGNNWQISEKGRQKLSQKIGDLLDAGELTRFHGHYKLGPQAPIDKFPELEAEFEAKVANFLANGLSLPVRILVLEYFGGNGEVTPFEYWAGKRKVYEMIRQKKLIFDQVRCVQLPVVEDPIVAGTMADIEGQLDRALDTGLSMDAEQALGQLGMSKVYMVKPKQRDRYQGGRANRHRR